VLSAAELNNRGAEHSVRGENEGARLSYLAALNIDPNNTYALANLGNELSRENKLSVAETIYQKLVALDPLNGNHWNNLGNVLTRLDKFESAFAAFEKAKESISHSPGLWHNQGLLFYRKHDYKSALRCFEQCEALGGGSLSLQNDVAHALLALGNLPSALENYEARWNSLPHLPAWDFHIPEWRGEDLAGKRLLLHVEQGYGDTIMTLRFISNLTALGADVVLAVPDDLARLCEAQDWTCTNLFELNESNTKQFDFHSPFYSAMRWLGIELNDIDPSPYISVPPISVPTFAKDKTFNVGICWASGRRGNTHDWRLRHAPLELWLPMMSSPDIQFWSLQKGPDASDIQTLGLEALIKDPTYAFDDWAATAAFISELDLVISVDTALVHLAGALGLPCWMLSQFSNCWRWWNIDEGSGRPWYDSVEIIRQNAPGDWKSQLEEAAESLKHYSKFISADRIARIAA
jgi:tetratricopeptide (TPR) repeat protein